MSKTLLDWSDTFNTGITQIDEQHRTLVRLLNQLHQSIQERKSKEVSGQILRELTEYTVKHFGLEEQLMQASQYAGFAEHRRLHAELIAQIQGMRQKYDAGQTSISFELLHFLRLWLTKHIGESDKRFGAYFVMGGYQEADGRK